MKSIILSINPQWVEKILNKSKLIEIRKVIPQCETPFKVYIYCTGGQNQSNEFLCKRVGKNTRLISRKVDKGWLPSGNTTQYLLDYNYTHPIHRGDYELNGKVVAEFVVKYCEKRSIKGLVHSNSDFYSFCNKAGFDWYRNSQEFFDYVDGKEYVYLLHISNLKVFDKPKELGEFKIIDNNAVNVCEFRERIYQNPDFTNGAYLKGSYLCKQTETWCSKCKTKPITRPPQNFMFCEEIECGE